MPRLLFSASQGAIEFHENDRNQAQAGQAVQGSSRRRSGCPKGEEAQKDERRGARTRPSSADQALGRSETGRQDHRRSIVEVEEEIREGRYLKGGEGSVTRLNTAIQAQGIADVADLRLSRPEPRSLEFLGIR
jgi:hypothetical protein